MVVKVSSVAGHTFASQSENTFMTPEPEFPVITAVVLVVLGVSVFVTLIFAIVNRGKHQREEQARDEEKARKKEQIEMRKKAIKVAQETARESETQIKEQKNEENNDKENHI